MMITAKSCTANRYASHSSVLIAVSYTTKFLKSSSIVGDVLSGTICKKISLVASSIPHTRHDMPKNLSCVDAGWGVVFPPHMLFNLLE